MEKDLNGKTIKTGDIVEIKNAYFKNDNGIYFVEHSVGDPTWSGNDYSLTKMCKNGKLSTSKNNLAFWPLSAFTNNRDKNAECRAWNREHATIEIIETVNNVNVVEYFKNELTENKDQLERELRCYGEGQESIRLEEYIKHFEAVIARVSENEIAQNEEIVIIEEAKEVIEEVKEEDKPQQAERKYYTINEEIARSAKLVNSFSDYRENEATEIYVTYCEDVYNTVDEIACKKPELNEKASNMADYYCRKLAEYYNDYYRNEASCPSVLISGAGNFPTGKKNKQNNRRDTLRNTWNYLSDYKHKIDNLLKMDQPILSNDANAVNLLEEKIEKLEAEHNHKMYCNNYYKKNKTLKGCEGLSEEQIEEIESFISRNPFSPPFIVVNDMANIRRYKERLETLKKIKAEPITEEQDEENGFYKVVKNTEIMRLQMLFDGKPDPEIRDILKKNGFRWSPKNAAWQRQLTDNAMYSLKRVKEAIDKIA